MLPAWNRNVLTFTLVANMVARSCCAKLDTCQYSFNVWEPNESMQDRMNHLETKYANLSNYMDKELLRLKYSTLSDVQHFQNWTSNLERILSNLKLEQLKKYSDVSTMNEQLQRYETKLQDFGNRFDDFVFHYTTARPTRRKHSRKDRMLPISQSDTPGNFLVDTLKNMVSDLKSEWILMKRDIIDLKKVNAAIKTKQTSLIKDTDDVRKIANHAESQCKTLKNSQSKTKNDMLSFKAGLENVKQDIGGLQLAQESLRNDILTTANNLNSLQHSTIHLSSGNALPLRSVPKESMPKVPHDRNFTPKDCADIAAQGYVTSGVYQVQPAPYLPMDNVYCEIVNNTGYTVIQRRTDGLQSFKNGWLEYRFGFGNLYGSFWLGNEIVHVLTKSNTYGLRIDLWDWEGHKTYAEYDQFSLDDEANKYMLHVSGFHGNAGDSLGYHDGMRFSTMDNDNDLSVQNCADDYKGGWWYSKGYFSQLNGVYHVGVYSASQSTFADGIVWFTMKDSDRYSLRKVEMKLKRLI